MLFDDTAMGINSHIKKAWDEEVPEEYHEEPAQMRTGMPGKEGYLRLDFTRINDKNILDRLDRRVPLFAQRALYNDENMPELPCVTMISTSGCVLQGDRLMLEINVGKDACAQVSTQSATKIHSMDTNYAAQMQHIRLAENSYLEFMPCPLILQRNSRFINDTIIERGKKSTLIYSEIIIPGRIHHHQDELFGFDYYSSTVTALDENDSTLFKEKFILRPHVHSLNVAGVMGEFKLYGSVIVLTESHYIPLITENSHPYYGNDICYGTSTLPDNVGVIFKVLANDSGVLKKKIREFWQVVRKTVLNVELPPPFLWKK